MAKLDILEHKSSSYAPRTYANAAEGDVTIALALDYTTAGERLTHKAAGDKYLKLDPLEAPIMNSRKLWQRIRDIDSPIINVAGNGIYTLTKHNWTQAMINFYLFEMFQILNCHKSIGCIRSGGQTGVDIAGAWAGYKLGIDTQVLLPKGYLQRHEDGVDRVHTQDEIYKQIVGN